MVEKKKKDLWIRLLPLAVIILLMLAVYLFDLMSYFTIEELKRHRVNLIQLVSDYPILAPLTFMLVYAISTALSLPIGAYLTLIGGFLFDQPLSTISVVIGATAGASTIFAAAKTAFRGPLKEKVKPYLSKFEKGFQENAWSYLLFLRLIPLFPFWLVNIAPAFLGVRLWTFVWTTFVGIIPGAFAYSQVGTGLGSILDSGEPFSLEGLLNQDVQIALVALGILSLLPILYKKVIRK